MSLVRYGIELAYPEPISPQLRGRLNAFENAAKAILPDAVIINEGQDNEEKTKRAVKHICYHDETPHKPCELEEDI